MGIGDYARAGIRVLAGEDELNGRPEGVKRSSNAVGSIEGVVVVMLGGGLGTGVKNDGTDFDSGGGEADDDIARGPPAGGHRRA